MIDFETARQQMVDRQLAARGISDPRVLDAMRQVPRHAFVERHQQAEAYDDTPLPIGDGQSISQPYMVAIMTQLLRLEGPERVLEVGTGSGYQAAVLTRLCSMVYTIERIPSLLERSRTILEECGYENIQFKVGDGSLGWPEEAPFDAILVTAGAPAIPSVLVDQLTDGGRLVVPVGDRYSQTLKRITKTRFGAKTENFTGCRFVDLVGRHGWSC